MDHYILKFDNFIRQIVNTNNARYNARYDVIDVSKNHYNILKNINSITSKEVDDYIYNKLDEYYITILTNNINKENKDVYKIIKHILPYTQKSNFIILFVNKLNEILNKSFEHGLNKGINEIRLNAMDIYDSSSESSSQSSSESIDDTMEIE